MQIYSKYIQVRQYFFIRILVCFNVLLVITAFAGTSEPHPSRPCLPVRQSTDSQKAEQAGLAGHLLLPHPPFGHLLQRKREEEVFFFTYPDSYRDQKPLNHIL